MSDPFEIKKPCPRCGHLNSWSYTDGQWYCDGCDSLFSAHIQTKIETTIVMKYEGPSLQELHPDSEIDKDTITQHETTVEEVQPDDICKDEMQAFEDAGKELKERRYKCAWCKEKKPASLVTIYPQSTVCNECLKKVE